MVKKALNDINPHAGYAMHSHSIDERPVLAALIGRCLISWADVDLQMALLLTILIDAQSEGAVAVFLSFRSGQIQASALRAAAGVTLNGRDRKLFDAILKMHKTVGDSRNDIAHNMFGTSGELPDSLLAIDVIQQMHHIMKSWRQHGPLAKFPAPFEDLRSQLYVYQQADLEEILSDIRRLRQIVIDFVWYLRLTKDAARHHEREGLYSQLCHELGLKP